MLIQQGYMSRKFGGNVGLYCMDSSSEFHRTLSLRHPRESVSKSANGRLLNQKGFIQSFRSKSSKTRQGTYSLTFLHLTSSQRNALNTSWRLLKPQIGILMRKIFADLEVVSPKVKDIFYKAVLVDCFVNREFSVNATLDEHVKYMMKFFNDLILNIDCETETMAMIKQIGQHHSILNQTCGFQAIVWEQLGEITMEKICGTDAVQKTREAGHAWRTVIAFITDKLRCGFDTETKAFSRRSSAEQFTEEFKERNKGAFVKKFQKIQLNYNETILMQKKSQIVLP